jgi:hypothetical protein
MITAFGRGLFQWNAHEPPSISHLASSSWHRGRFRNTLILLYIHTLSVHLYFTASTPGLATARELRKCWPLLYLAPRAWALLP